MALLEMGFNYKSLSKIAVYLQNEQNGMGFAIGRNRMCLIKLKRKQA